MVTRRIELRWVWLVLALFLSACVPGHKVASDVIKATETIKLSSVEENPVAALIILSDDRTLLSAYAGMEGKLKRWDIKSGELLAAYDLGPVSVAATAFDPQGKALATAAGKTVLTDRAGYSVSMYGAKTWDAQTGRLRREDDSLFMLCSDIALGPDAYWVFCLSDSGGSFWGEGEGEYYGLAFPLGTAITLNAAGDELALVDDSGIIETARWTNDGGYDSKFYFFFAEDHETALALAFDPTEHWLADLRHTRLKVWDLWELEKWLGRLKEWRDSGLSYSEIAKRVDKEPFLPSISTSVPAGPAGALAFSPSGDLLAVGTKEGWQLWSVQREELLIEHKAEGVYALTFSPDGQLFAWGDVHGTVHVWQIVEEDDGQP